MLGLIFFFLVELCGFGLDLGGELRGNGIVAVEGHFEEATALRHGAELRRIAIDFRERNFSVEDLHAFLMFHAEDAATAGIQIAGDGAHVFFGEDDLQRVDGFEQHGLGVGHGRAECTARGDLKRHFGGVNVMVFAVIDDSLEIDDFGAGERADQTGLADAFFNGGNVVLRDVAADDFVCEDEIIAAFLRRVGFEAEMNFGELAVATGLLLVAELRGARAIDGFTVGDSGRVERDFNLEIFLQTRNHQVHVLVTHAGDDGLLCFGIAIDDDGRVFVLQTFEACAELVFFALCHGGNRVEGSRLRIFDGTELDARISGCKNIVKACILEFCDGDKFARACFFDGGLIFALNLEEVADALFAVLGDVEEFGVGFECAAENADVVHLADEGVVDGFEDIADGGGARAVEFAFFDVHRDVLKRGGAKREDGVREFGDAEVLAGGAEEDWNERTCEDGLLEACGDFFRGEFHRLQVLFHQSFIRFGDGIHEGGFVVFRFGGGVFREDGVNAFEGGSFAVWNRAGDANRLAVAIYDVFECSRDIDLVTVAAVDENHAGHLAVTSLVPCADGARADAGHGVNDKNHHVAHIDGVHGFAAEIAVSGGVSEEEMAVFPGAVEDARVDGVLAFLFFSAEIGDGGPVIDASLAADDAGLEEEEVGKSGFTGAGMTGENEISNFVSGTVFHVDAPGRFYEYGYNKNRKTNNVIQGTDFDK